MSSIIRFSPDLSAWISQNLDQGATPTALMTVMRQQRMEELAAQAITQAFVTARRTGRKVPVDHVVIDEISLDYIYPSPLFGAGNRIQTADRLVHINARAERPFLANLSNVFSTEECAQLIELARPRLTKSTIVDPMTGKNIVSEKRTSYGMFFKLNENDFIAKLDQRISAIMNLPIEHGEGIQILYYPTGAGSDPHFDFLTPLNPLNHASLNRSGQRCSTLVTYLNHVEEGGETVFPEAGWAVSPIPGNAVYFEYANAHGQVDHASLHASNPVITGEKWVATKWMRQRPFVSA
ncbi:2OG-Fe(II) oxygenase [Undibacterium sp. RuRC25W]|uniref:2OG-Fe(II) oxygenase n=1 Tax=Undibacterium sp. RuRC25W TaxID=3413047 RepID=UPI003BF1F6F7